MRWTCVFTSISPEKLCGAVTWTLLRQVWWAEGWSWYMSRTGQESAFKERVDQFQDRSDQDERKSYGGHSGWALWLDSTYSLPENHIRATWKSPERVESFHLTDSGPRQCSCPWVPDVPWEGPSPAEHIASSPVLMCSWPFPFGRGSQSTAVQFYLFFSTRIHPFLA